MGAKLIDGKAIAEGICSGIAREVKAFQKASGITPGLAVVLVGDDPASQIYVRRKKEACARAGIISRECRLSAEVNVETILGVIGDLNRDPGIHGILVQLPLPRRMDEKRILEAIDPGKDVDGFHPYNVGRLWSGDPLFVPCTPRGILELIRWAITDRGLCSDGTAGTKDESSADQRHVDLAGLRAVVIGRSNIVGKPVAALLLRENATVTICHSRTRGLQAIAREADILVVAIGKPEFIGPECVKPGAIVIDVGMNRGERRLVGDVDFKGVREVAGYITPVPGGVGPMTIAMLLKNTLEAAMRA